MLALFDRAHDVERVAVAVVGVDEQAKVDARVMRRIWSANSVIVSTMRSGAPSVVFDATEPASMPIS